MCFFQLIIFHCSMYKIQKDIEHKGAVLWERTFIEGNITRINDWLFNQGQSDRLFRSLMLIDTLGVCDDYNKLWLNQYSNPRSYQVCLTFWILCLNKLDKFRRQGTETDVMDLLPEMLIKKLSKVNFDCKSKIYYSIRFKIVM